METVTVELPNNFATEAPSNRLRWLFAETPQSRSQTLQQLWMVTTYEDGKAVGMHEEWRNVPIEIASAPSA